MAEFSHPVEQHEAEQSLSAFLASDVGQIVSLSRAEREIIVSQTDWVGSLLRNPNKIPAMESLQRRMFDVRFDPRGSPDAFCLKPDFALLKVYIDPTWMKIYHIIQPDVSFKETSISYTTRETSVQASPVATRLSRFRSVGYVGAAALLLAIAGTRTTVKEYAFSAFNGIKNRIDPAPPQTKGDFILSIVAAKNDGDIARMDALYGEAANKFGDTPYEFGNWDAQRIQAHTMPPEARYGGRQKPDWDGAWKAVGLSIGEVRKRMQAESDPSQKEQWRRYLGNTVYNTAFKIAHDQREGNGMEELLRQCQEDVGEVQPWGEWGMKYIAQRVQRTNDPETRKKLADHGMRYACCALRSSANIDNFRLLLLLLEPSSAEYEVLSSLEHTLQILENRMHVWDAMTKEVRGIEQPEKLVEILCAFALQLPVLTTLKEE